METLGAYTVPGPVRADEVATYISFDRAAGADTTRICIRDRAGRHSFVRMTTAEYRDLVRSLVAAEARAERRAKSYRR